jgi:CDP-diacylglycerol--glycerol-3-phosphate 3-phosphatidyltransferase
MIESLKPIYNNALRPFARFLAICGVSPNAVTVSGVAVYVGVAWLIASGQWKAAVAVGVAGGFLDGIDGIIAREFDKKSVFGGILDSTCDRFTEILAFCGLMLYYLLTEKDSIAGPFLCLTSITGSLMVSYVKARAEGAGLECNGGIMQRTERMIVTGVFLLLGPSLMLWGLALVSAVSYITVFQRLIIIFGKSRNKTGKAEKK